MKKKLLIVLAVAVLIIVGWVGYMSWSSRNTAKAEADKVLVDFADKTGSQWYCENGSGKGVDNDTLWWEQVYLSNESPEETAIKVNEFLASKGYSASNTFVEKIDQNIDDGTLIREGKDHYNRDYAFWKIEGSNNGFTVTARVSDDLTSNNCFSLSNKDGSTNPDDFATKIVIKFQDL